MATSILATTSAQLNVDAETVAGSGNTVTLVNTTLLPQPGGAVEANVTLLVNGTVYVYLTLTFFDEAFSEYNIYGGRPSQTGSSQAPQQTSSIGGTI